VVRGEVRAAPQKAKRERTRKDPSPSALLLSRPASSRQVWFCRVKPCRVLPRTGGDQPGAGYSAPDFDWVAGEVASQVSLYSR
jgi:hypothetical protein